MRWRFYQLSARDMFRQEGRRFAHVMPRSDRVVHSVGRSCWHGCLGYGVASTIEGKQPGWKAAARRADDNVQSWGTTSFKLD